MGECLQMLFFSCSVNGNEIGLLLINQCDLFA